ncbi:ABC transporter ATP-binding protein [Rhabdothermincola salaria]|uniref:ABC transporter ATP-binding protein n=1 Tax=Rhabdothermincola salaria TaxID=2903142 RepID=UPI001E41EEBF|nr:ABC transporter ATP-binding protein [Rhabdothermincola salaria]MCD9624038.1 ABC transporter ATP-binding protein [Rhabdothermincola salaria]
MSHLVVKGLSVTFAGRPPVAALRSVDLEVADGSIVAVLGPSGCGKTTLLRVIAGLQRPGAGRVELDGVELDADGTHLPPEKRGIGLVPQEGALFPHLDVAGNVAFGLRQLDKATRTARIEELLAMVGLEGLGGRRPHEISGGQQQRVALARALAPRPSMVLLDEPFSALDAGLRAEVRAEVTRLLREAGTTAVMVTHDQAEALEMADAVAVMRAGRIIQVGPPAELYREPHDTWVGAFLGDAIAIPGIVDGPTVTGALGPLRLRRPAPAGSTTIFLRPEQLRLLGPEDVAPGGAGVLAEVRAVRFRGHEAAVDLVVDGVELMARWPSAGLPPVGATVRVGVVGDVLALEQQRD